jgi:hypothetical protein
MATKKDESGGTLVRGADGELYYIPDAKLEAFRLPQAKATAARKLIGSGSDVLPLSVVRGPAVRKAGLSMEDYTIVSVVNVGAIRNVP